jgi:IS30 family transposase
MYKHLSREERYQIYSLLKAKQTISQIARSLGRSRSTISRERSRGCGQRGSNENFNGLLRQYIPKKGRMETVTDEELTMIENRLNHRPRKRLGFKTPHEVFHASLKKRVAVRT